MKLCPIITKQKRLSSGTRNTIFRHSTFGTRFFFSFWPVDFSKDLETRFNKKLPYTISNTFLRDRVKTTKILIDHLYLMTFTRSLYSNATLERFWTSYNYCICRIITNDALKLLFTTIDEIRFQLDDFKQREQIFIFSWGKGNEHTIFNLPVYKAPSLWVSERVGFACNKNGGQIIVLYEKRARDVEEIHHHRIPVW